LQWHSRTLQISTVDEFVKLSLVKSYCLPLLSYCIGALDVTGQQLRELAVCWNDCFRRIFGFKRHESVELLQFYCSELPFELMHDLFRWRFIGGRGMLNASNRCFTYYAIKHCDDMKLRENYMPLLRLQELSIQPFLSTSDCLYCNFQLRSFCWRHLTCCACRWASAWAGRALIRMVARCNKTVTFSFS